MLRRASIGETKSLVNPKMNMRSNRRVRTLVFLTIAVVCWQVPGYSQVASPSAPPPPAPAAPKSGQTHYARAFWTRDCRKPPDCAAGSDNSAPIKRTQDVSFANSLQRRVTRHRQTRQRFQYHRRNPHERNRRVSARGRSNNCGMVARRRGRNGAATASPFAPVAPVAPIAPPWRWHSIPAGSTRVA